MNKYHAASIVTLIPFLILAVSVSPRISQEDSPINAVDTSLFLKVNDSHIQFLNQPMIWLTEYGREVVWTAAIILLSVFGGRSGRRAAAVMVVVILLLIPLGYAAKEIVQRPRPTIPQDDFLIPADSEYAFPSGHALIVAAGATTILSLCRGSSRRLALSLGLTVEAALVSISRVYVGAHYPLDVVGGVLLGAGVAFIFIGSADHMDRSIQRLVGYIRR